MNDELTVMHQDQTITTSLQVAKVFGKQHKNVLEAIKNLIAKNPSVKNMFTAGTHDNRGKEYSMYYMNRDGFLLLVMGFTGKKAMQFKLEYIKAFNSMEKQLQADYTVPKSYAEALRLAAEQAEKIEQQKQAVAIQIFRAMLAETMG